MNKPSRLCVDLPAGHGADAAWEQTTIAGLDQALADAGYAWSRRSMETEDTWSNRWHLSEPRRGEPWNNVVVVYSQKDGRTCDMRVELFADMGRPHGELEWRTFFLLRDSVLPALMPTAAVSVLDHPGLWTSTWDVPRLAARFASGERLPQTVRERIDAYESRSVAGRWWERSADAAWTTWKRTGGAHVYAAGMYFAFPPNWSAFVVFALAIVLGRKVVRSPLWRRVGFMGLAVVLLMPVKVPTFVGAIYMPHGFVQVYDFDPLYYAREPVFVIVAGLFTVGSAWLVLRLARRFSQQAGSSRSAGSPRSRSD